ncbi:MAG: hypothetical protein U1E65_05610 [Myxococcota bacterium]
MHEERSDPHLDLDQVPERWKLLARLAALIEPKRALFPVGLRFGIAFAEGDRFTVDPGQANMLTPRFDDSADVLILTNTRTMRDLLDGAFDPEAPEEGHLFVWAGKDDGLMSLAAALAPGRNLIALRASR